MLHKLKFRFSTPYRIRMGCGISAIRSEREYNALIDFCKEELACNDHLKYNRTRRRVYEATLKLHDMQDTADGFWFKLPYCRKDFYNNVNEFIEDHSGWYWN